MLISLASRSQTAFHRRTMLVVFLPLLPYQQEWSGTNDVRLSYRSLSPFDFLDIRCGVVRDMFSQTVRWYVRAYIFMVCSCNC